MPETKNYFIELNNLDFSGKTEEKNNLTYLPWAVAWAEVKKIHPDANYIIYEREDGRIYWDDGKTAWVKTGAIINGLEHIERLPVMNHANKSIPVESITSCEVNKSIQRSLTKAFARHGVGLYIYIGEDLPEIVLEEQKKDEQAEQALAAARKEVGETGSKLKASGVTSDELRAIVSKYNDGNPSPSSIPTLEVCATIMKEFTKMLEKPKSKTTKTKTETKNEESK